MSFDKETLKELLSSAEGLEPAELLPQIDGILTVLQKVCRIAVLVGPVILLVMGLLYLLLPAREANYYYGYRTWFGMGSEQAWKYTQRIAGALLGLLGLILTPVMYFIGIGFASMDAYAAAWKAVRCLLWEAGLVLLATLAINLMVTAMFNSRGIPRRKKKT